MIEKVLLVVVALSTKTSERVILKEELLPSKRSRVSKQIYNWKRFFCPRTAQIDLSDRGYLVDPQSEWGKHYNPGLVGLEAIADIPCLILLGEPGIGKSQEMENLRSYTETKINSPHTIFKLNLRSCTSLKEDLFQDEEFIAWKDGTHRLYLFLDSLDEGLLEIPILATQLVDEFKKKKYRDQISRLYLRIACRTAVFPKILEEGLAELWAKENLSVYELAPLRQVDVAVVVTDCGIDAEAFLRELEIKNAVPFAIKPISLNFLVTVFQENQQQFPINQRLVDLYEQGCRHLCKEQSPSRLASGRDGKLEEDERLIIAARIAAVTVFALRSAIWTSPSSGDDSEKDVLPRELCLGNENAYGRSFSVTEKAIKEVLDSGLFSSRGSNRMGWAHQTYAEFMAAWYLKQHSLNLSQILNLIIHPDHRVIPQLQETTAWLASMIPEVFQEVMKTDPDVLLQSDISTIDDENKAQLVESLLRLHDEEKLEYSWRRYNNLAHPGLAEQLESYIRDSSKNQWSRLVAIAIAQDCDVKAVQNSLADIALDPTQLYIVRTRAAHTICDIGDEKTKVRLKPLVLDEVGNDPRDDLKGYALQAGFPQHISVHELVENITQPKSQSIGGTYSNFLAKNVAEKVPVQDLPVMLKWLEKLPNRYDLHYPFDELADSVMLKAWQNIDEPGVLESFANVAVLRLKQHDSILGDHPHQEYTSDSFERTRDTDLEPLIVEPLIRKSNEKRRRLIEAIVLLISESESDFLWLTDIICSEDILWMIERATSAESHSRADIWVKLLRQALNWHNLYWKNTKHIDAILQARSISSAMRSEFEIEIELGSERAAQAEASYLQCQNWSKPSKLEPTLDPSPKQRVLTALEKVEAGQLQLWWQIVVEMTLIPTSKKYIHKHIFESDVTKLPGWEEAEADTKARIIKTAKNYLIAGDPETQTWLGTKNFSHPTFAGYQALYLLVKQEPEFIPNISTNTWIKWIPVILKSLNFPHRNTKSKEDKVCREIVKTAYQSAPDEFIETLIILMMYQNYQPRTFYSEDVYRLANDLLDQCLASLIFDRVPDEDWNAGMLELLLTDLFKCDVDKAKAIAQSFLPEKVPESGEARDKAIVAARLLANYPDNSSWSVFWSAVQQDHEFGREVLEAIAFQAEHYGQIEQKIKEDYLADLYIFLSQQYPEIEQPEPEIQELRGIQAQMQDQVDGVRMWKNYIPQRLQARGTPEACAALRKIIYELPEQKEQLQQMLLEAESLARRNTWKPPKPEELLQLVGSQKENQSTYIQTGVLIMHESNNPNLNFGGSVGAVNVNSTVHGDQIGTQQNYASEQNLVEAFDEIQQIFNRLTQTYPTSTESEQKIVVAEAVKEVKQNPTLMKRVKVGGRAFIFEALQKASDQWWVSPFVKAIEAGVKGE